MKRKSIAVHKDLRTPKYRMRVVASKVLYKRKAKNVKEGSYYDSDGSNRGRVFV